MDSPSFEQQPIESDLKAIASEVNRAQAERTANRIEQVEAVKNAIRSFPNLENAEHSPVSGLPTPAAPLSNTPLPAYALAASPEVKREIEFLLDVAMSQGITKALAESEKAPYFVQDAFHDALAGKLYPELQKRGLIK